jgi:drug/metabolite transporter (DMT)-like permease
MGFIWIHQRWGTSNLVLGCVLVGIAAMLLFFEAAFVLTSAFEPVYVFGIAGAVLLMSGAVLLQSRPRYRVPLGGLFLVVSFLSLGGDSGFFLGSVLGLLGGALVLTSRDVRFENPMTRTLFSTHSLGNPCSRCGRPVPSWTGTCPYCGYPDR